MRLTEKHLRFEISGILAPLYWINENDVALELHNGQYGGGNAIDKLGQLEDIEDELGIDLTTLIKAMKDGIFHNQLVGISDEAWRCQVDLKNKRFYYHIEDMGGSWYIYCYFKDYGKTWALTKEELL